MHDCKILYESDLDENVNFEERELFVHGYKILYGGDLNENVNFGEETIHAQLQNRVWGDLNENVKFKTKQLLMHGSKFRFSYMKGTILLIELGTIFNQKMNNNVIS